MPKVLKKSSVSGSLKAVKPKRKVKTKEKVWKKVWQWYRESDGGFLDCEVHVKNTDQNVRYLKKAAKYGWIDWPAFVLYPERWPETAAEMAKHDEIWCDVRPESLFYCHTCVRDKKFLKTIKVELSELRSYFITSETSEDEDEEC